MATQFYTASSIDGFIADPEHSLSWLLTRDIDGQGPMNYNAFIADVGAIAMGSNTYRWILEHPEALENGRWPYRQPTWVFTHGGVPAFDGDIRITSAPVAEVHAEMAEAAGRRNLWVVGGGGLAGQFADSGLLDEVWVQYAPVALGSGAPLLPRRLELRLEEVARNRDFACARYSVVR